MKKLISILLLLLSISYTAYDLTAQTVTGILVPQHIQGLNGTNNNRVPFVYRAKIDGLTPNATYRYINQIVNFADGPTVSGAGNCIFVNSDSTFIRTTSPSLASAGNYGEFTTDATGSATKWFINEPTGNARFVPGNYIYLRIRLNDGAGGTTAVTYLTISDSVKVIDFGTTSSGTVGTAIYGVSFADPKDFVFLYDNVSGTGRPISSTLIESDGLDLSAVTSYALFYRDSVENKNGYWGSIIPNQLPNGIRRIERRLFSDGSIHPFVATDADGIWPSGANTVNPTGGLNPVKIESSDAPLPVELVSFSASVSNNSVLLKWRTATEVNNLGFEIQRKSINQNWTKVGYVIGSGTSSLPKEYSFIDKNIPSGSYSYRLKQIDANGTVSYSGLVNVDLHQPNQFRLDQNYPNPFNPSTSINYQIAKNSMVTIKIYNTLGNEVANLVNEYQTAGSYNIHFSASDFELSSGTYFYELRAGDFVSVKKMLLLK